MEGNNAQLINNGINNNQTFSSRITKENIHSLVSDLLPSVIIVTFVLVAFGSTSSWCTDSLPLLLKGMIFIYTLFIIKSIVNFVFLYQNTENNTVQKVSMISLDLFLTFFYYVGIIVSIFVFKHNPDNCFKTNTYPTILIFCIILFGVANIARTILNNLFCLIIFPLIVYSFMKNPSAFYANFGIDPEIVDNLPTIQAGPEHSSACAICTHDILLDEEILVLKCEGRHFYHAPCIKSWLCQKVNCPVCRSENVI